MLISITKLSFIFFLIFSPLFAKPVELIEYFKEIKKSNIAPSNLTSYKIFKKNGAWYAKDSSYQESPVVKLKLSKNFLNISQELGDGRDDFSIKEFKTKQNLPIVCITKSSIYSGLVGSSEIFCAKKTGTIWQKINIIPKVDISSFLTDDMSIKDLKILKRIGASLYYQLFQNSNKLLIKSTANNSLAKQICSNDNSIKIDNKKDYIYYCNNITGNLKKELTYLFDPNKSKFVNSKDISQKSNINIDKKILFQEIVKKRKELLKRFNHE